MFDFKKKILNPLISTTIGKLDEALKTEGVAEKTESLLAVKEEAKGSFDKVSAREATKGDSGLYVALASLVVAAVGSMAMPFLIPAAALYAGGIFMALRSIGRQSAIRESRSTLEGKISDEVLQLMNSNPQDALKSPRFLKALKEGFNTAANKDQGNAYEQLRSSIKAKVPAPQPVS